MRFSTVGALLFGCVALTEAWACVTAPREAGDAAIHGCYEIAEYYGNFVQSLPTRIVLSSAKLSQTELGQSGRGPLVTAYRSNEVLAASPPIPADGDCAVPFWVLSATDVRVGWSSLGHAMTLRLEPNGADALRGDVIVSYEHAREVIPQATVALRRVDCTRAELRFVFTGEGHWTGCDAGAQ